MESVRKRTLNKAQSVIAISGKGSYQVWQNLTETQKRIDSLDRKHVRNDRFMCGGILCIWILGNKHKSSITVSLQSLTLTRGSRLILLPEWPALTWTDHTLRVFSCPPVTRVEFVSKIWNPESSMSVVASIQVMAPSCAWRFFTMTHWSASSKEIWKKKAYKALYN